MIRLFWLECFTPNEVVGVHIDLGKPTSLQAASALREYRVPQHFIKADIDRMLF